MALASTIQWEVRTDGSDTNGGGFKPGASGTDWTQQASPQYSVTDAVTNSTTTITSATANFGTDVVGNVLYIQGGTSVITAGWYEITARNSSTSITVDRNAGLTTGSGATLKIGGALATPGQAAAIKVAGNKIWVKSGTYTLSSSSANVSGGRINETTGTSGAHIKWEGYNSTRGDRGTKPVIEIPASGISSITMFTATGYMSLTNIAFDGKSKTSIRGLDISSYGSVELVKVSNCTNYGIYSNGSETVYSKCEITGCTSTTAFLLNSIGYGCEIHDNSGVNGVAFGNNGFAINCISYRNSIGFTNGNISIRTFGCTAAYNTSHGFSFSGNVWATYSENCVAYGNGGYGWACDVANTAAKLINCGGGSNTSGNVQSNLSNNIGFVTLTADPFTNAVSTSNGAADFSLNNNAGGGEALRAAASLGVFPAAASMGYLDIGAVQHQDSGGGSASPFQLRGSPNIAVL